MPKSRNKRKNGKAPKPYCKRRNLQSKRNNSAFRGAMALTYALMASKDNE